MKPLDGSLKINVDAAWLDKKAGIRFIVRDSDSFVLGGGMQVCNNISCPAWTEIEALLHAITWARNRNLSNIIFESDYADVINRMSKPSADVSLTGYKIRTCSRQLE